MTLLTEWLATPVRNKKEWDWSALNAAIKASEALVDAKDKPEVLKNAMERLLKTEPHVFWRCAKKLKPALKDELLALAKKSDQVQCQLYAAVAPKGLTAIGAFHCGLDGYDQKMRALSKVKEAQDEDVLAAARAIIADKKKFLKGVKKPEDALGDEGRDGIIALLVLADDLDALRPIWGKKFVSENRDFLVDMAKPAKAKKVLAALR